MCRNTWATPTYALYQEIQHRHGGGVDGGVLGGQVGAHGIDDGVQHRDKDIPNERDDVAQHFQRMEVHFAVPVRQSRRKNIKYLNSEGHSGDVLQLELKKTPPHACTLHHAHKYPHHISYALPPHTPSTYLHQVCSECCRSAVHKVLEG